MRIISGIYGGRKYNRKAPDGVRPTLDAVRESIFNILNNYIDYDDLKVLDICAGTGALGFEALSRGVASCDFVDKSKNSIDYIKAFAQHLNLDKECYEVINVEALKYLQQKLSVQYDLIFTDPPYIENFISQMTKFIEVNQILTIDGIMVVEHSSKSTISYPENWVILSKKNQGLTSFEVVQRKEL